MLTLGIDPGGSSPGGAVLLDEAGVSAWWVWSWLRSGGGGYRLRSGGDAPEMEEERLPDLHLVGCRIREAMPERYRLVVEGLYVPTGRRRGRVNPQSVVPLAESAGLVMGPLLGGAIDLARPLASEWRRSVLGLPPRTSADSAEEYAVQMAPRLHRWPGGALPEGLTLAEEGAIAEACLMAGWKR